MYCTFLTSNLTRLGDGLFCWRLFGLARTDLCGDVGGNGTTGLLNTLCLSSLSGTLYVENKKECIKHVKINRGIWWPSGLTLKEITAPLPA